MDILGALRRYFSARAVSRTRTYAVEDAGCRGRQTEMTETMGDMHECVKDASGLTDGIHLVLLVRSEAESCGRQLARELVLGRRRNYTRSETSQCVSVRMHTSLMS